MEKSKIVSVQIGKIVYDVDDRGFVDFSSGKIKSDGKNKRTHK